MANTTLCGYVSYGTNVVSRLGFWSVPQKADKVGRKNSVKIRKGEKDEKTEKFYRRTKM